MNKKVRIMDSVPVYIILIQSCSERKGLACSELCEGMALLIGHLDHFSY